MKTKPMMLALALGMFSIAAQADVTCSKPVNQLQASTPSSDFIFHGDGTVTHKRTGLMWQQCLAGESMGAHNECMGTPAIMRWQDALQHAHENDFAGHSDWRLASIKELSSILESSCADPMMNEAVFPSKYTNRVWSSTPLSGDDRARSIHLGGGTSGPDRITLLRGVRLVRDTK